MMKSKRTGMATESVMVVHLWSQVWDVGDARDGFTSDVGSMLLSTMLLELGFVL